MKMVAQGDITVAIKKNTDGRQYYGGSMKGIVVDITNTSVTVMDMAATLAGITSTSTDVVVVSIADTRGSVIALLGT